MTSDPAVLTKLDELMAAIRGFDDPRRATVQWKQVYKLLTGSPVPPARVTHVVGMRDLVGLAELVDQLRSPVAPAPRDAPDAATCQRALRAFRKRLSLTRLDDESRISPHSPLSKGGGLGLTAIVPPDEWPESVWRELVRQGRLRDIGRGLYELLK